MYGLHRSCVLSPQRYSGTAGAGSLILEFATLSRLTGDPSFEKAAKKAFFAIWNRKSDIGLVGNTINIRTGDWISPEVLSIGAGIDSFFEYAIKWYILSGMMILLRKPIAATGFRQGRSSSLMYGTKLMLQL